MIEFDGSFEGVSGPPRGDVQDSAELRRILALPRRVWDQEQTDELVRRMTEAHKTPAGTQTLLPLQAIALAEMAMFRGAHIGIPVGGGKTLVQLLSARMFPHVRRPLYLLPAHLVEKTHREAQEYRKDWVLPHFYRIESYQTLSRVSAADLLDRFQPDLVVLDEAHFTKNVKAGVTKRIFRYLREHPDTIAVFETGTPFGVSLKDFAHQMSAALREGSPVPRSHLDLDEWCRALDADVPEQTAMGFGALYQLDERDPIEGFQRRLRETPGIILSRDPPLPIPVHIETHLAPIDPVIEDAIRELRKKWRTPDGIDCKDGVEVWRHAREISTGFYSVWVPRAPEHWREARAAWARECRETLSNNRRDLDTEEQLIRHMAAEPDHYPEALETFQLWQEIEPDFVPNPVPHWISDTVIDWVMKWSRKGPGLIWTDRPTVGQRLADRGLPYYGEEGVDARTGRFVMDHDPKKPCVLARRANDSGRNLQAFDRNLIIDVPARGTDWEQLIGRTHRRGQKAQRISVDVLCGVVEDVAGFWKAHGRALRAQQITGQAQKLCHADLSCVIEEIALDKSEPRWVRSKPPQKEDT